MNSFYGGKEGRTYHIVQRYDCINLETIDSSKYIDYATASTVDIQAGAKLKNNGNYYIACSSIASGSSFSEI